VLVADRPDSVPAPIRAVRPDDDLNAQLGLTERSFGPISSAERDQRRQPLADGVAQGRVFGAFDRSRPVGAAMFHDMRQWWCGRAVPMAGVGGVNVAPEDRGRGVARRLMAALYTGTAYMLDGFRRPIHATRRPGARPGRCAPVGS